jgi:hypothetical protein
MRFARDQVFASPSAAAAVVTGRQANGRVEWKIQGSGLSFGGWQDQGIDQAAEEKSPLGTCLNLSGKCPTGGRSGRSRTASEVPGQGGGCDFPQSVEGAGGSSRSRFGGWGAGRTRRLSSGRSSRRLSPGCGSASRSSRRSGTAVLRAAEAQFVFRGGVVADRLRRPRQNLPGAVRHCALPRACPPRRRLPGPGSAGSRCTGCPSKAAST